MTGPQQSRPSPAPRGGGDSGGPRPSPRARHGRDGDFPENSYQGGYEDGGGYPDLRASRPVDRTPPAGEVQDLYGGTGPQPVIDDPAGYGTAPARDEGGYAAPARYDGYGAPVQGTPDPARAPAYDETAGYGMPTGYTAGSGYDGSATDDGQGYGYGGRPGYGEYGDSASRGGTAIDGGPPYTASAAGPLDAPTGAPAPTHAPSGAAEPAYSGHDGTHPGYQAGGATDPYGTPGTTAVADRDDEGRTVAAAVPAQRAPAEGGRRPSTVAEAAAVRFGPTGAAETAEAAGGRSGPAQAPGQVRPATEDRGRGAAPAATVAKDPAALTVLRVVTYVLVSLSCLVFLAGVVYGVLSWLELREALGSSPLFGGSPFGG
ncbi:MULTISPECIES: hypothetical protein [unclassified Pseudonocardia]|uniref:hypothetical protein n=1 Tax=unclassified Pseudonocardia TaxID=2619320 RepID=UPI00094AE161|nr:hypothetical protein [Pseudonocardia sp. Ae707_Ps1]OLM21097.1 hypothetical protein Ae707Ps1_5356 [Pseudonocardia sp. Ae707_Ps1]